MVDLVAASGVVLVAATLQACTGFGFSVLATPFLLLIYDPHSAIQINILLSLVISIVMVPRIQGDIDRGLMVRLVTGSVLGAPAGIAIFLFADVDVLKIIVSLLILGLTGLLALRMALRQNRLRDGATGVFSGILTTSIGMPGPPLLLYFAGARIDKATLRATTLGYFLFIYALTLVLQVALGTTTSATWINAAVLAPVTFAGIMLGQALFRVISQAAFRIITLAILGVTGAYLLASTL